MCVCVCWTWLQTETWTLLTQRTFACLNENIRGAKRQIMIHRHFGCDCRVPLKALGMAKAHCAHLAPAEVLPYLQSLAEPSTRLLMSLTFPALW